MTMMPPSWPPRFQRVTNLSFTLEAEVQALRQLRGEADVLRASGKLHQRISALQGRWCDCSCDFLCVLFFVAS
jgi:hypothetical protein